jgi:hypothetical protein
VLTLHCSRKNFLSTTSSLCGTRLDLNPPEIEETKTHPQQIQRPSSSGSSSSLSRPTSATFFPMPPKVLSRLTDPDPHLAPPAEPRKRRSLAFMEKLKTFCRRSNSKRSVQNSTSQSPPQTAARLVGRLRGLRLFRDRTQERLITAS